MPQHLTPADPFAQMAGCIAGNPVTSLTGVDPVENLQQACEILRADGSPAARAVAGGLADFLARGGDLAARLGLRARRGGAYDLPHNRAPLQRRDELLRGIAAELAGSAQTRAVQIATLVSMGDPRIMAIQRETSARIPTSPTRIASILRGHGA